MSQQFGPAKIRAVLLDIEGTTTPIDFVFKTLFPYASSNVEAFLARHLDELEIKDAVAALHRQHVLDASSNPGLSPWSDTTVRDLAASAATYVRWLISRDSKITPLKSLQGRIWEEGYKRNELKGEIYPDVPRSLARWSSAGIRIAIFSSGSVLAQQLLFKHSTAGDLTPYLEACFDTTVGAKREPPSYRKIAAALRVPPEQILFVSDVISELDAARAVGMSTTQSLRPGVPVDPGSTHRTIQTFDALLP